MYLYTIPTIINLCVIKLYFILIRTFHSYNIIILEQQKQYRKHQSRGLNPEDDRLTNCASSPSRNMRSKLGFIDKICIGKVYIACKKMQKISFKGRVFFNSNPNYQNVLKRQTNKFKHGVLTVHNEMIMQ